MHFSFSFENFLTFPQLTFLYCQSATCLVSSWFLSTQKQHLPQTEAMCFSHSLNENDTLDVPKWHGLTLIVTVCGFGRLCFCLKWPCRWTKKFIKGVMLIRPWRKLDNHVCIITSLCMKGQGVGDVIVIVTERHAEGTADQLFMTCPSLCLLQPFT